MNGLPYYKAYPRDFIEGTVGMPFELKGAYRLVLDLIYMQGGELPDDSRYISGLLGCSIRAWNGYRKALVEGGKLIAENGAISNYRARKECETSVKLQDKMRENRLGHRKNNDLQKPTSNHTDTDTEKEESPLPKPDGLERGRKIDFFEAICNNGVAYLVRHGRTESAARKTIGKWRKKHSDELIFSAFAASSKAGVTEPVSYITRILEGAANERLAAWGIKPHGNGNFENGGDIGSGDEWNTTLDLSELQRGPEAGAQADEMPIGELFAGRDSLALSPLRT